jgi:hypothetical protein
MVTEEGYLYAEKGVFSGTVESAEIKTATITGKGDTYGLTIYSGAQGSNGLFFGEQNNNIPYVTMSAEETTIYNTFSIKNNNTILFKLLSYKEKEADIYEKDAIGMFSTRQDVETIEEYYLNIRKMTDDKIGFYWKEKLQFSLSEDGFDLSDSTSNTLKVGNNLKVLPVPKSCGSGADFYAE